MIIGEAPGQTEVRKRRPFVGDSGLLLRDALSSFGVEVDRDAYITNAVMCHPEDNATPTPAIWRACRERLFEEIRERRPEKILTVGAIALASLLNRDSVAITKERGIGRFLDVGTDDAPLRVFVVPTFHPAALLRNPSWFPELTGDIGKWLVQDEPLPYPSIDTIIVETAEQALDQLEWIFSAQVVSCDVETSSKDPRTCTLYSIGFGALDADDDNAGTSVIIPEWIARDPKVKARLWKKLTNSAETSITFHNAPYDLQVLSKWFGEFVEPIICDDTMMMHYALDERSKRWGPGHSLKILGGRYDIPDYHFPFDEFYAKPEEDRDWTELFKYQGLDCYLTARLRFDLQEEILEESEALWRLYCDVLRPTVITFTELELRGVLIDRPYLEETREQLISEMSVLLEKLTAEARLLGLHVDPVPFDLRSPVDIWRALAEIGRCIWEGDPSHEQAYDSILADYGQLMVVDKRLEVDPEDRSAKMAFSRVRNRMLRVLKEYGLYHEGHIFSPTSNNDAPLFITKLGLSVDSTEKEALWLALSLAGFKEGSHVYDTVALLIEYRNKAHLLSTYVTGLLDVIDENDRAHPDYNIAGGTSTGRIACEKPNLMNIPQLIGPIIHRGFIAPPGWSFVNIDYSQLELRVAAYYSQDAKLIDAYVHGRDVHREVASAMFKKPPEEITYYERYLAKYVDFGVIYGRQAKSLTEGWEMEHLVQMGGTRWTEQEAERFITEFLNEYKGLKSWINEQHRLVIKRHYIETFFGFRRRFPYIDRRNVSSIQRQAVNTPIQSTAAHICLTGMNRIRARLKQEEDKFAFMLLNVHDSIGFEVRNDRLDDLMKIAWDEMVENVPIKAPFKFKIEAEVGPSWGDLEPYPIGGAT